MIKRCTEKSVTDKYILFFAQVVLKLVVQVATGGRILGIPKYPVPPAEVK
jgi:hypothetical protein